MAESPFRITRSDDGLFVSCEFDAHYVSDEDAKRIRGYIDQLETENDKLRELVQRMLRNMHGCNYYHSCGSCDFDECVYEDNLRELGIEAE